MLNEDFDVRELSGCEYVRATVDIKLGGLKGCYWKKNEWIGEESEGGTNVTTSELQDAIYHWLENISVREHIMSTENLQEIIAMWLSPTPTTTSLAIFKELTTPLSISGLAKRLALNNSTISTAVSSLIIEGLAVKQRNGKKVIVKRSDTLHAHSLEDFLKEYPRLPIKKLFSYSSMKILSELTYPHNITDIAAMTGLNRHTSSTTLLYLSKYGIVLKKNGKYSLNQRHRHVVNFIGNYWSYIANQRLRDITEDVIILWQRGPEFLFKVQRDLDHNNEPDRIHPTATTVFSGFDLGLIATTRYYFYTKRQLTVEDYILHTILVDQQNSIYNSYALALAIRSRVKNLLNTARRYDIEEHIKSLLDYLRTKEKNSDFVLPWDEYLSLFESMEIN